MMTLGDYLLTNGALFKTRGANLKIYPKEIIQVCEE